MSPVTVDVVVSGIGKKVWTPMCAASKKGMGYIDTSIEDVYIDSGASIIVEVIPFGGFDTITLIDSLIADEFGS